MAKKATKKKETINDKNKNNCFYAIGTLTKDPELKETPTGIKYVNITLSVEGINNSKHLYYTLWEENAEKLCEASKKGSKICVTGHSIGKTSKIVREGKPATIFYNEDKVDKFENLDLEKTVDNEDSLEETDTEITK